MNEAMAHAQETRDWDDLLASEEAAFQAAVHRDNDRDTPPEAKAEAVRDWWLCVNAVLWRYVRTKAQTGTEPSGGFPAVTLGRLANIAEELSNGIVPTIIDDARGGGRPLYRAERHHIARGILYIRAVKRGEIMDRAPVKTVASAFNVTKKAVQGWLRKGDDLCVGVPQPAAPETIEKLMREAGGIYSRIGRGAPGR